MLASLALCGDEEGLTLLRSAAAKGNPAAEYGMYLYRCNNNPDAAYHWLEKSAEQGDANALYALSFRYENEKDDEQKLRCLRHAAEKGHADAQTKLGLALEVFDNFKAPENEEAFRWMKAAADQGHALANYCLGNFYRSGTWVDADKQKAFECYTKAAELGNSDGIERLGECYFNGDGVEMDHNAAFQYMRHAAELGNPKGQCYVGLFHLEGIGCRQDTELGFRWISEAAQSGHIAVVKLLQQRGLDFTKLSTGYKEYRQLPPPLTENCVVRNELDTIFDTAPKGILPVAPDEI